MADVLPGKVFRFRRKINSQMMCGIDIAKLLKTTYDSNICKEELEKRYTTHDRCILIALIDNEIIGCTFVQIQEDYVRPNRIVYVTYVAVNEKYQKQGVGKRLFSEIERICNDNDCTSIELTSANFRTGAHAFYNAIGFSKKILRYL